MFITATITLNLNPSPLLLRTWQLIERDGQLNKRLADLITIEPGFGLELIEIEDAEITKGGEE